MSKHCWTLKDRFESQFSAAFYPIMLSGTIHAEIIHRAEEIRSVRNDISEIFFSDMLGFRYVEQLLKQHGRCIVVINEQDSERDDLMEDFVSIITSFTTRLYGRRRSRRRAEKLIEELKKDE